jgi:hypothetical protein
MRDLDEALTQAQPAIRDALTRAEHELDELMARRVELEALITRARAVLGESVAEIPLDAQAAEPAEERRTLHEALKLILRENGNRWMTVSELAKAVNEKRLYSKRDGSPVEPNQIHARTNNYSEMFEKNPTDRSRVRLRQA